MRQLTEIYAHQIARANKLHSNHKFYPNIWQINPFKNYIFAKILINAELPGIS